MPVADEQLFDSIGLSPIATVISNPRRPDNPLEVANPAFCALTGYSESEIVGRNCRFLAGEATEPWITDRIRDAIGSRRPVLVDILNYRRDGSPFRNGVLVTPLVRRGRQSRLVPRLAGRAWHRIRRRMFDARRARAVSLVKSLPERRRQVLELMARGLLNKQIAWELKISEKTVKMHRALLLEQLGVATSADAIRIAVEAGL